MVYCDSCGKEVSVNDIFCQFCGSKQKESQRERVRNSPSQSTTAYDSPDKNTSSSERPFEHAAPHKDRLKSRSALSSYTKAGVVVGGVGAIAVVIVILVVYFGQLGAVKDLQITDIQIGDVNWGLTSASISGWII